MVASTNANKNKISKVQKSNKKLTKSSKNFTFKSFKDRIDSIKIEPSLNLSTRVYDDVENTSSHFISTLNHWKEVNLSANFTEFAYEIQPISQSLHQIIYHQHKIFESLFKHIQSYDPYSIQPLLELLTQFVHDLGSDFMAYYSRALKLLIDISLDVQINDLQNNVGSSNLLEWIFNNVSFMFKYLSKELVGDFKSTFDILLPILSIQKQQYLARFCSEALSYIIKRMKPSQLDEAVEYLLIHHLHLIQSNITFKDSLIVLFTQSIISVQENFHSKANVIYENLIKISFKNLNSNIIITGVLSNIFYHGNSKTVLPFVDLTIKYTTEKLDTAISESDFNQITEILITLVFAESGRKITNWNLITEVFLKIFEVLENSESLRSINIDSLLFAISLLIRNCEVLVINKNFKKILDFTKSYNDGKNFVPFIDSTLKTCEKNLLNLSVSKHLQNFIATTDDLFIMKQLSLFDMNNKEKLQIVIPESMTSKITNSIAYDSTDESNVFEIFWKLNLLLNSKSEIPGLNEFVQSLAIESLFISDFVGLTMNFINKKEANLLSFLERNFDVLQKSTTFLKFFTGIISSYSKDVVLDFIPKVANNLSLNDNQLRIVSADFILSCFEYCEVPCPEFISSIKVIETIPLTLGTARDIQLRIRLLFISFQQLEDKTPTDCKIMSNYAFGLMNNRFQPSWQAVFENLERIASTCDSELWILSHKYITMDYNNQLDSSYTKSDLDEDFMLVDSGEVDLLFNDERISTAFNGLLTGSYQLFRNPVKSIITTSAASSTVLTHEERLRGIVLEALAKVPTIVESHSKDLLQLVLDDSQTLGWSFKDRNSLLTLFTKFKSLKSIENASSLYQKALDILTSQRLASQKLALDVILSFKNKSVSKYKDNLKNLLDDTLFKDELTKFITQEEDSFIETDDLDALMPIILRILFGRVQGGSRSNSKNAKKNAVINALPILTEQQVIDFLKLGSDKIGFNDTTAVSEEDFVSIRRMNGFVTLLNEVYDVLGYKFKTALATSIRPLIYSMAVAQLKIDSSGDIQEETEVDENVEIDIHISGQDEEKNEVKSAKRIRQLGMRCLNELFKILGDSYDWESHFTDLYKYIIQPRLLKFNQENLQQPSSLLNIMISWIRIPGINKFLLFDDLKPAKSIISLLENRKAKDSVIAVALGFAIDCLKVSNFDKENEDSFFVLLAILVESLLNNLSDIITSTLDIDIINKSVTILLMLIEGDYIVDNVTRNSLIDSLVTVFNKPVSKIAVNDRERILISLSILINDFDGTFDEFLKYYKVFSKSFRIYEDKSIRNHLVDVFVSIGSKFNQIQEVSSVLKGLNSYVSHNERLGEPDFESVLSAYKKINEELYSSLDPIQWLPIIYCSLYFLNDDEELVIRTNANYVLNHFVDCFSGLTSIEDASEYVSLLKTIILPDIRQGLRSTNETVQTEYINTLSYIVEFSKHFDELSDMKVLLMDSDDEASFFKNINHIQLHRRQRAIRRIADLRSGLRAGSISHYILPIIENYAYNQDEKLRNVSNEAITSLGLLLRNVTWNQLKSIFKRYVAKLRVAKPEVQKTSVKVVVEVSKSLSICINAKKENTTDGDELTEFPKDFNLVDSFILGEIIPVLQKILNERNDDTIVHRITLAEGLVSLIKCISESKIDENLPGLLTSTCQVLRSRSEELRDAARKSLCKITQDLGTKYFKFLLQELKGALTRGSQIHVLSFTMHALLSSIQDTLAHGDLDESIELMVEIIMEDTFGAAGQEKDAEGYTSKMKEVKHKKSNDSAEILSSNISLTEFNKIIDPVKLILQEKISLKIQNKLDELLRRYALGLNHNEEASSKNILILSYQINRQAEKVFLEEEESKTNQRNQKINDKYNNDDNKDHFLVKLNARPLRTQVNYDQYKFTLQKFSFELLRAAISRHTSLLSVSNMQQFVPLLDEGINSNHEGLIATCLRLLHTIIQLPFSEEVDQIFKKCARKTLTLIKDSPNTTSDVCQSSLKFLATLLRHKSGINLKDTAISYVLDRIQPDLEEPKTQGLAFNFLKSVVSQHILLPEVYDIMDLVSKIMVVNHNREIRDMARSIYFQFLMEYDQGRGKLEKQFKFLVNNLGYATQEGRQSVLELINLIVNKSGEDLLNKIASSFFVALSNILVTDDSSKSREMASLIISNLFKNLKKEKLQTLEKYLKAWLEQDSNPALLRCGFNVYKIYINQLGLNYNAEIDRIAIERIQNIFERSSFDEFDGEDTHDVEWQLVYASLVVFAAICGKEKQKVVSKKYESIWRSIINTLLFPHSWVRLNASRLIGILLSNLDECKFEITDYEIQTIAYRLLRQLAAPHLVEDLGNQIVKNLILIAMRWHKNQTQYIEPKDEVSQDSNRDDEEVVKFKLANEFLVNRTSSVIKQYSRNSITSKKVAIKLSAMLIQLFTGEILMSASEEIILALFPITENSNGNEDEDLVELSTECLQMIEKKLGGSAYTEIYARVQKTVNLRRQERRTKRAQLAITNPDVAAKRKLKKHARFREKRKHVKDENGYYHSKKRRR